MEKALCNASQAGEVAEVGRLLDSGAEADAFVSAVAPGDGHSFQTTALGEAAVAGHLDVVRLLLDRGADPSLANSNGDTTLMMAARRDHVGVVRELAARGAALDAAHPATGGTAFHWACDCNQPECMAALVELGCDTGMKDKDGMTGKQRAKRRGHRAVLERLTKLQQRRTGGKSKGSKAPKEMQPRATAEQLEQEASHRAAEAAKRGLRAAAEEREAREAADQAAVAMGRRVIQTPLTLFH